VNGSGPGSTIAPFRSYADATQSFQDYVSILRSNPRYAAALNTGTDARAFATGLQRGGYATDPEYARKVSTIANNISVVDGTSETMRCGVAASTTSHGRAPATQIPKAIARKNKRRII